MSSIAVFFTLGKKTTPSVLIVEKKTATFNFALIFFFKLKETHAKVYEFLQLRCIKRTNKYISACIYWHQISEKWEGGGGSFSQGTATWQLLGASDWDRGEYKAREGPSRATGTVLLLQRIRRLGVLSTLALTWPSLGEHVQIPVRDSR